MVSVLDSPALASIDGGEVYRYTKKVILRDFVPLRTNQNEFLRLVDLEVSYPKND